MEEIKEKNGGNEKKLGLFKLLSSYADRIDVILMIVGSMGAIANGASQPISTLAFSQLVTSLGQTDKPQLLHQVSKVALNILFVAIGGAIAGFLQVSCWSVCGERQSSRIRALYLKALLRQEIAFFDTETTTSDAMNIISQDSILIHEAIGEKVGKFIELASTFISGFIIAFARGWFLSMILLSCIPAIVIVAGFFALIMANISSNGQAAYAEAGNVVEQTLGAIRTVASFSGESVAISKYNTKLKATYITTARQGLVFGLGLGFMLLIAFSTFGLTIWYGSRLILHKGYNGGDVANVIIAIMVSGSALAQASSCIGALSAGQGAGQRMMEIMNRQPLIDPYDTRGIVKEDVDGEIEFQDVFFRYPSRPDVQIFDGFTLKFQKGRVTALVGQSGSGKSTIISLLERFYDPDGGRVMVDGVDLRKYQLRWIRERMGLVSQEPVLFSTTLKENILYGKTDASDEEIESAITLANCAEFIEKLPRGLDTMVGENGMQLSGGQKQRIAIARAIVKNPKILLLDEATSALDATSERNVQVALEKVMPDRTTIVVAHRLSTIKNAHVIAVIHAGKLIEQGTHDDLVGNSEGAYRQLLCMQDGSTKSRKKNENDVVKTDNTISQSGRFSFSSNRGSFSNRVSSSLSFGSEIDKKKKDKSSIIRLAHLNRPELPVLLVGSVAASVHGVAFPTFGFLMASAFRIFFEDPNELEKHSRFWALMFVAVGGLLLIAAPVQNYMFGVSGGKLVQRVCSSLFEKVVHREISWFDDPSNSSGAVRARLSADASTVRNLVGNTLALAVQNIATTIAGLMFAFLTNWKLALTVVVMVPLMLLEGYFRIKLIEEGCNKVVFEEASRVANDAIRGIRTVVSFSAEWKVKEMYEAQCEGSKLRGVWNGVVGGASLGFANFILFSVYAFSFYIGAVLTTHDHANFGQVFKVFFALQVSSLGIAQSGSILADFKKFKDSAVSIFEILDRKSLIDSSNSDGLVLESIKGDIKFKHVSFKYSTRPDVQIFKDLNLCISPGKTYALVGESGSGKSTVISLLQRFYDPDSGYIMLDGIEISKLNLRWLRKQMGLVSQEPVLFNETIRYNICYGRDGECSTEDEVVIAAKAANAHNFISALPCGYDTCVGEKGIQLSGGQKQRIAIARVILKDPKIVLLDEATSALDAESERLVMETLDRIRVGRTTLIVAHRLTTVKCADTIAVMKDGVVAEKGTHDVLMGIAGGIYATLVSVGTTDSLF